MMTARFEGRDLHRVPVSNIPAPCVEASEKLQLADVIFSECFGESVNPYASRLAWSRPHPGSPAGRQHIAGPGPPNDQPLLLEAPRPELDLSDRRELLPRQRA